MEYDYTILGGGIAGLCLADRLQERGKKILLIDPKGIGQGASGTPSALLNPATGRYAHQSWRAEECINATYETLEKVQAGTTDELYLRNGIVRPSSDAKIGYRMKENLERTSWPDGWCEWMETTDFRAKYPGIMCKMGAVKITIGCTVKLPEFLHAFAHYLRDNGVRIIEGMSYRLQDGKIQIDGNDILCRHFITAAGIASSTIEPWTFLPLHPVKGQIALFKLEEGFPYKPSVSSLGYYTPYDDTHFAVGSTYEHEFTHEEADEKGLKYLKGRLNRVMPELHYRAEAVKQWAGVRASTPGRMPILGTHPEYPQHSVFSGLGSKGLLYSSYLADLMTEYLEDKTPLPEEIRLQRFL